jgi:hypothetical protein
VLTAAVVVQALVHVHAGVAEDHGQQGQHSHQKKSKPVQDGQTCTCWWHSRPGSIWSQLVQGQVVSLVFFIYWKILKYGLAATRKKI